MTPAYYKVEHGDRTSNNPSPTTTMTYDYSFRNTLANGYWRDMVRLGMQIGVFITQNPEIVKDKEELTRLFDGTPSGGECMGVCRYLYELGPHGRALLTDLLANNPIGENLISKGYLFYFSWKDCLYDRAIINAFPAQAAVLATALEDWEDDTDFQTMCRLEVIAHLKSLTTNTEQGARDDDNKTDVQ